MLITRISMWSGTQHTVDIPVTRSQIDNWRNGTVIQLAMPNLEAWQREFMLTGMTQAEWLELEQEQQAIDAREDSNNAKG